MPQEYTLKPMTKEENLYAYRQDHQIAMQTGYYGYLRGDYGWDGKNFNSSFEQFSGATLREHFENERNSFLDYLEKTFPNLQTMKEYCEKHEEAANKGVFGTDYGFRVDAGNQTFLLILHPRNVADYALHLYVYDKYLLDNHMSRAAKGIRFIDPHYNPLFELEDGDGIIIKYSDGEKTTRACRYIDEYHTLIGSTIYHICQFAELMDRNGATVIPYRNSLPDKCYIYVDTKEVYATVTKGKDGYEPFAQAKYPDKKSNWDYVNEMNKELDITNAQVEAMTMASMMGWADKLADPRYYEAHGKNDFAR